MLNLKILAMYYREEKVRIRGIGTGKLDIIYFSSLPIIIKNITKPYSLLNN